MQVGASTYIGPGMMEEEDPEPLPIHEKLSERYPKHPQSDSEEEETEDIRQVLSAPKEQEEELFDYRLGWALGFFLAAIALVYFYFVSVACCVPENEETNLTIQYAIEKSDAYTKEQQRLEDMVHIT